MGRITACAAIVIAMVAFALYGYNYSDTCARRIYLAADEITQAGVKKKTPQNRLFALHTRANVPLFRKEEIHERKLY